MNELEDIVFENMPLDGPAQFEIDTLDKANWATKKIARAEEGIQKRNLLAKTYIERINKWLEESNKHDKATIENMTRLIEPYVTKELIGRREKNIDLFFARVGFRKSPERIEIEDEAAAIAYCEKENPEAVKIEKSILKKQLKDADHTPGVSVCAGENRFYIQVNTDELQALKDGKD
jgi:hypothetical protein